LLNLILLTGGSLNGKTELRRLPRKRALRRPRRTAPPSVRASEMWSPRGVRYAGGTIPPKTYRPERANGAAKGCCPSPRSARSRDRPTLETSLRALATSPLGRKAPAREPIERGRCLFAIRGQAPLRWPVSCQPASRREAQLLERCSGDREVLSRHLRG